MQGRVKEGAKEGCDVSWDLVSAWSHKESGVKWHQSYPSPTEARGTNFVPWYLPVIGSGLPPCWGKGQSLQAFPVNWADPLENKPGSSSVLLTNNTYSSWALSYAENFLSGASVCTKKPRKGSAWNTSFHKFHVKCLMLHILGTRCNGVKSHPSIMF